MSLEVVLRDRRGLFRLDVGFRLERKGIAALFGPSGAGKSTIIHAIAGLIRPCEGRVVIDGETVLDTDAGVFVPARRRRAVCVFQDARLFPHLSVENNLLFGWRRAARRVSPREREDVFDLLGLKPLLRRRTAGLSGGEKSRVALGRALLASPRLLLLDEPLAALDAARKAEILPWLERLRDEARVPMIYVTHAADEVARLADHLIVLDDGRVAAAGSVFDLFSDPEMGSPGPSHGAVFPARIEVHHDTGLTALAFDGGTLFVPHLARPVGAALRVRIRADDVMIALRAPAEISANNVLAVEVAAVRGGAGESAEIRLACGRTHLLARITQASLRRLALAPGARVFAIVKSVTIDPQLGPPVA